PMVDERSWGQAQCGALPQRDRSGVVLPRRARHYLARRSTTSEGTTTAARPSRVDDRAAVVLADPRVSRAASLDRTLDLPLERVLVRVVVLVDTDEGRRRVVGIV